MDGSRDELVLARRNKAKYVRTEDCEVLLEKVTAAVRAVEGTREARKADGAIGRTMRLFVEKAETREGGGEGESADERGS